jgi:hypothetical protein
MGRIKPKIVTELMGIANRFADGEDACHNKGCGHPKMTEGTGIGIRGEGPTPMITTAPIVK